MQNNGKVRLFPYILTRTNSGSVDDLRKLSMPQTKIQIEAYLVLNRKLKNAQDTLSPRLYSFISQLTDAKAKQRHLRLRRDIFNGREVGSLEGINEQFTEDVNIYLRTLKERREYLARIERIYTTELENMEHTLLQLVSQEYFQKALLLSSTSLYAKLKNIDRSHLQDRKFVRSLMKYVTRAHTKTTPYSTFVEVSVGNVMNPKDSTTIKSSIIRVNNNILKYILGLLYSNGELRRQFPIKLNPTVQVTDTHISYLTNNNNRESFQKIKRNASIDLFHTTLVNRTATYRQYIEDLIRNGISASKEEIEQYPNQLIEYGFIEYALPVSGTNAYWDRALLTFLSSLKQTDASSLLSSWLKDLRLELEKYADSPVQEREQILSSLFLSLRSVCRELHQEAGLPDEERASFEGPLEKKEIVQNQKEEKDEIFRHSYQTAFTITKEHILYEDFRGMYNGGVSEETAQQLVDVLDRFSSMLFGFDGCNDERDRLLSFYRQRYTLGEKVPLLQFYEEYFREYKKPMLDRVKDLEGEEKQEQMGNELIKRRVERNNERINSMLASARKTDNEVEISETDIKTKSKSMWEGKPRSYAVFIMFGADESGKETAVVESIPNGWGKMMSRFLHLFEDQTVEELRRYNTDVSNDYEFVENIDASFFNANIHPPLMPFEVAIPSGHNNVNERERVKVKDLEVYHTDSESYLGLYDSIRKKRIFIFDNGFQGLGGRSELFNLLDKFSIQEHVSIQNFCGMVNERYKKENDMWVKPRITIVNNIVIQRRSVVIPFHLLPFRQPKEKDWEYVLRLNEWRQQYQIADEVFISISSGKKGKGDEEKKDEVQEGRRMERIKAGRDDYKPQYISFTNPYLVDLFERMCHKVTDVMEIQEMLPITTTGRVKEILIQWYS